jgi:hypothetical protein
MDNEEIERTEVQASGGIKLNVVRYILFASTGLAVVVLTMVVIWISSRPV